MASELIKMDHLLVACSLEVMEERFIHLESGGMSLPSQRGSDGDSSCNGVASGMSTAAGRVALS